MVPTPTTILFTEIHRQLNAKFPEMAVFWRILESKKQKCVFFLFIPDGFTHMITATVRYDQQTRPGDIGYRIDKLSRPFEVGELPATLEELQISQTYCYPKEQTLDSAFIACVQCEMAFRAEENPS